MSLRSGREQFFRRPPSEPWAPSRVSSPTKSDHTAETLTHQWREDIECADLIDRIARDLAAAREPGDGFAEDYWDRYPGF
jgi:hypothetical protein